MIEALLSPYSQIFYNDWKINSNRSDHNIVFDQFLKGKLDIEINDNGKGISEKNISEVFEMGYTTTKGSGIGLFQVHDLVTNNLKGKILLSSKEKEGTNIKITI